MNPILIDLILVAVVLTSIYIAARKGIIAAVSGIIGSVAGFLGAMLFAPVLSGPIAKAITPLIGGMVKSAAQSAGIADLLASPVVTETKEAFVALLEALHIPSGAWENLAQSAESAGDQLSAAAGGALAAQLAPILAFVLLLMGIKLAVWLVARILSLDIPVLRTLNHGVGALVGGVSGVLIVLALCWGVLTYAPVERIGLVNQPALRDSVIGGAVADFMSR